MIPELLAAKHGADMTVDEFVLRALGADLSPSMTSSGVSKFRCVLNWKSYECVGS